MSQSVMYRPTLGACAGECSVCTSNWTVPPGGVTLVRLLHEHRIKAPPTASTTSHDPPRDTLNDDDGSRRRVRAPSRYDQPPRRARTCVVTSRRLNGGKYPSGEWPCNCARLSAAPRSRSRRRATATGACASRGSIVVVDKSRVPALALPAARGRRSAINGLIKLPSSPDKARGPRDKR